MELNRYNNLNNSIMKNRQLMRLNLVSHKGQVKTIDCIAPGQVILLEDRNTEESFGGWVDLDEIEFIELTEDWLLKMGFKRFGKDFVNKTVILHTRKRGFVIRKIVPLIKHLHQLQNYFFALTGEELTIKN